MTNAGIDLQTSPRMKNHMDDFIHYESRERLFRYFPLHTQDRLQNWEVHQLIGMNITKPGWINLHLKCIHPSNCHGTTHFFGNKFNKSPGHVLDFHALSFLILNLAAWEADNLFSLI